MKNIVITILLGASAFLTYQLVEVMDKQEQLYTEVAKKDKIIDSKSLMIEELNEEVRLVESELYDNLRAFESQKNLLLDSIRKYEDAHMYVLEQLEIKINDLENCKVLVQGNDRSSTGHIDELITQRNKLIAERDALILKAHKEEETYATKIGTLQSKIQDNEKYITKITETFLKVYEVTSSLRSKSLFLDSLVMDTKNPIAIHEIIELNLADLEKEQVEIRNELYKAHQYFEDVNSMREQSTAQNEANASTLKLIQQVNNELKERETTVQRMEKFLSQRYWIVAPKKSLVKNRILKKTKSFLKTKYELDFTRSEIPLFNKINTEQFEYYIPKEIKKLHTQHPSSSYEIVSESNEDSNILRIKDHELFWQISKILVIEIED